MSKVFILLSILFSSPSFAYFEHAEDMEEANGDHTVHLLSDLHGLSKVDSDGYPANPEQKEYEEKKNACEKQRIDLLNTVRHMNGCVIVEDMPFNNNVDSSKCLALCSNAIKADFDKNIFSFDPNKSFAQLLPDISHISLDGSEVLSPLPLLTQFCYQQNIRGNNVEFRFLDSLYKVTDLLKHDDNILTEVKGYKGNDQFNGTYSKIINEYESKHKKWSNLLQGALTTMGHNVKMCHVLGNGSIKLFDYGLTDKSSPGLNEMYKNEHFKYYHTSLIDLKILHSLYNLKTTHKNIFVCAGAYHITNTKSHLIQLGYTSKYQSERSSQEGISSAVDLAQYFKK